MLPKIENPKLKAVNPHFKSKFAPLDEVLRVVEAGLGKNQEVRQSVVTNEQGALLMRTALVEDDKILAFSDIPFVLGKQDPQGLGSAITYHRRYGLCLMFNLVGEDDDDGNASTPSKKTTKKEDW